MAVFLSAGVTMSREIFLIQNDGHLIAMREQAYDSEALLQDLPARYPHVGGELPIVPQRCLNRRVIG